MKEEDIVEMRNDKILVIRSYFISGFTSSCIVAIATMNHGWKKWLTEAIIAVIIIMGVAVWTNVDYLIHKSNANRRGWW